MFQQLKRWGGSLAVSAAAIAFACGAASAQAPSGEPIKIGFGMSLTGPLAANGKSSLLAMKIWEEDTNAKGGLLGRPVKLVYYDDQSSPAAVPAIYSKLLDVDKVDLIVSGYASTQIAAAMPVAISKKKLFISLFGTGINDEFRYDRYFSMIPNGPTPKPAFTRGFFKVAEAQNPKPQTIAIAMADAEFGRNACEGAAENAKAAGFKATNQEALTFLASHDVDAAIVDFVLCDGTGESIIDGLKRRGIPFIVVSGAAFRMHGEVDASHVLTKPVPPGEICRALSELLY